MRGAAILNLPRQALTLALISVAATAIAAPRHPSGAPNLANAKLLKLPPAARAAELAKAVGHWYIGTEAFPMGLSVSGRGAGDAYWSLRCSDGSAWAVQIDPLGAFTAIDCVTFDADAAGDKCFEKIRGATAPEANRR